MKDKYPLEYLLNVKRGIKWSERKILLDKEKIKYINPSNII